MLPGNDDTVADAGQPAPAGTQRVDKWLWFVRVVKTRTQAAALVTEGGVRLNTEKIDRPAQPVRCGTFILKTLTTGW